MLPIFRRLFKTNYEPLNKVSIIKSNIKYNYKILKLINPNIKISPVLKSNAYGHGIKEIYECIKELDLPFISVDSIFEAYELLKSNATLPILIMGYVDPRNLNIKRLPFSYAVFNAKYALEILKHQPNAKLHVFIDTGMNREGMKLNEISLFIDEMRQAKKLESLEGLMSHFASADEDMNPQTDEQLKEFMKAYDTFKLNKIVFKYRHISATFGILNNKYLFKEGECITNIARSGLAFYGYGEETLKPALRLTTKIAQVKVINIGEKVGYGATFIAIEPMTIAVLPIGYADGLDKRLSNKGFVTIKGVYCPILGKVSMNITTIDISNVLKIHQISKDQLLQSEVVIISENPQDKNSINNIAKICNTIEWEILVRINPSFRRVVI